MQNIKENMKKMMYIIFVEKFCISVHRPSPLLILFLSCLLNISTCAVDLQQWCVSLSYIFICNPVDFFYLNKCLLIIHTVSVPAKPQAKKQTQKPFTFQDALNKSCSSSPHLHRVIYCLDWAIALNQAHQLIICFMLDSVEMSVKTGRVKQWKLKTL